MSDRGIPPVAQRIIQELMESGKFIEAAWQTFRHICMPTTTSSSTHDICKDAFFAGATTIFDGMLTAASDTGDDMEPTDGDMLRMDKLNEELRAFDAYFRLKYGRPAGRG